MQHFYLQSSPKSLLLFGSLQSFTELLIWIASSLFPQVTSLPTLKSAVWESGDFFGTQIHHVALICVSGCKAQPIRCPLHHQGSPPTMLLWATTYGPIHIHSYQPQQHACPCCVRAHRRWGHRVFRRFPLLEHLLQTLSHGPHRTLNIQHSES
jgi:hypothetical protein